MKTTETRNGSPGATPQSHAGPVPFFECARSFERQWPDLRALVEQIIDAGIYSDGAMVASLESAIRDYTGAQFAVGTGNGTDGLVLLLRAAGIGPGDEVIVPCFTFVASATSIVHAGATPVFVDIDPVSYAIDAGQARARITPRTRAIMPVHLFAQMADMGALLEIARETRIMILEDSAEAIGMRCNGVHAGLLARGGVLSFFPTKTLGALGDAGMILTNDASIAEAARRLRSTSKMDEIQAAILLTRLVCLDADIARRAELARLYDRRLAPLRPRVRTPAIVDRQAKADPVYYVYVIESERQAELIAHLAAHGIGTEQYYPLPLHLQSCFAYLGYKPGDFPNAEQACAKTLALPLYPDLTDAAAEYVCDVIASFHQGTRQ